VDLYVPAGKPEGTGAKVQVTPDIILSAVYDLIGSITISVRRSLERQAHDRQFESGILC
jgi:hypothetical protein